MESEAPHDDPLPPSWDALSGKTLGQLLELRARQQPHRVALSAQSIQGFRDRLTYAQLALFSRRMGVWLRTVGIGSGDRVAIYLANDAGREAVLTALGCFAIGAVAVPMNTRAADDDLVHALDLVNPALVVCGMASAARLQRLTRARQVQVDAPADAATAWQDPLHGTDAGLSAVVGLEPDSPACLLFTSGTTSRSKAVIHSHRSMIAAGFAVGQAVGLGTSDLYQGAFPFFTSSCLNLGCMSSWVHGAGFVLEHLPGNADRLRLAESEQSTVYHGVPAVIQYMLDECERGTYALGRLRRIAYGGAPMPVAAIERIAQTWPWADQMQIWGMTESGPAGASLPPHWLPAKAGMIGAAMPNCELRAVDQNGQPVPAGEPGELCFRGPSMAQGYFENPQESANTFRDGWLHTGDIVVQDEDGLFRFVDRSKDVINRGGLKVSSAAIENALQRLPQIQEVAVIPFPHPKLGEEAAACIVFRPGAALDAERLEAHCIQWLADYAVPRHWFILESLPRNPMGKVLKRELPALIARLHSATDSSPCEPQ